MAKYKYKVVNSVGGSCFVPPSSEFHLDYKKGKHVKAKKGTLGVMVFPERDQAIKFLECNTHRGGPQVHISLCIKRVIPVGKVTIPDSVSLWPQSTADLRMFNRMGPEQRRRDRYCTTPPLGTECYPEVIVVD